MEELPLIAFLGGMLIVVPCAFVLAAQKRRRELPAPCVVVRRLWSVPAEGSSPSLSFTDLALIPGARGAAAPLRILVRTASRGPAAALRVFRLPGPDELPSMAATRAPRVVRIDPETWRVEVAPKADSGLQLAVSDGGAEPPEISADEGVAVRPVPAAAVAQLRIAWPVETLMLSFILALTCAMESRRMSSPMPATLFSAVAIYGGVVTILAYRHTAVGRVFQRLGTAVDGHWTTVDETAVAESPSSPRREAAPVAGAP